MYYLMIDHLSATADYHHKEASLEQLDASSMVEACSAVHSLYTSGFIKMLVSNFIFQILCPQMMWTRATAAIHCMLGREY